MIPVGDIERVYEIIDRELSFIELRPMNKERKKIVMGNWNFVREKFKRVCLDCAIAEGILKAEDGCQK